MIIIILAAGEGKRMNSNIPKILHIIKEKPMIVHVIEKALLLNPEKILVVVGKHYDSIKNNIDKFIDSEIIDYCHQTIPNGTGGAILSTLDKIKDYKDVIILSGDVPLISYKTLYELNKFDNSLLITELNNPFGNGRIIFGNNNDITQIMEEKDCNDEERKIQFVNCGIYKFQINVLMQLIPQIDNVNKNNEYYLTDIVKLCFENNILLNYHILDKLNQLEIHNINTQEDLKFVIEQISV